MYKLVTIWKYLTNAEKGIKVFNMNLNTGTKLIYSFHLKIHNF